MSDDQWTYELSPEAAQRIEEMESRVKELKAQNAVMREQVARLTGALDKATMCERCLGFGDVDSGYASWEKCPDCGGSGEASQGVGE